MNFLPRFFLLLFFAFSNAAFSDETNSNLGLFNPEFAHMNMNEFSSFIHNRFYGKNLTANMTLNLYKNNEVQRSYEMKVMKNGEKIRMEFAKPAIERGRIMLNDGDSLWMYLPRSKRIVMLAHKQSFMGTNASHRDLLTISMERDYDVVSLEVKENIALLTYKAKDRSIAYDVVKLHVDLSDLTLRKREFFTQSGKKLKELVYTVHHDVDGILYPHVAIVNDETKPNSKTEIIYSNVTFSANEKESYFTKAALQE